VAPDHSTATSFAEQPTVSRTDRYVQIADRRRVNFMATSDPLFPPTALLPQSDLGGVRMLAPNRPGALRPFAATLGVPQPIEAKKHDTTATKSSYRTNSETVNDGNRTTDSVVDTDVDD
jgi:hypothetical protein